MRKSLLDTDILSEVLKGVDQAVVSAASTYRSHHGFLTTSVVTVMEIVKRLQRVERHDRIDGFLASVSESEEVLPFGISCSTLAGRIYGDLERIGQPIGRADPMIASIAIDNDLVLVTGNTSHFERIQQLGYPLELANWRALRGRTLRRSPHCRT